MGLKTFGRYGTAKDLAGKISWEGGIAEFFLNYASVEDFEDTEIVEQLAAFVESYNTLVGKLADLGVCTVDGMVYDEDEE